MLTCLALVAFNVTSLADIPKMTDDIEADARMLAAEETINPELFARLQAFSAEAQRLSTSLHQAGVGQDMPCVFQGIAQDALERVEELSAADTQAERDAALMNLRVLMDDTIMVAPMAAAAASDRAAQRNIALR
jgi:hypothetical protein